jgi:hypothetical protein
MVLAVVTACAPKSQVASGSTVAVHGRVLAPDGSPATGLRVGLVKQLDAGEMLGGLFVIGVSLGLACVRWRSQRSRHLRAAAELGHRRRRALQLPAQRRRHPGLVRRGEHLQHRHLAALARR